MKRGILGVTTLVAAFGLGAGAQAVPVADLFTSGVYNTIQDQSGEDIYRLVNNQWIEAPTNTIEVGDVLAGVFTIDTVNGTNIGGSEPYNELTGLFLAKVENKTNTFDPNIKNFSFTLAGTSAWSDIFGITTVGGSPISNEAMLLLFEDSSNNFAGFFSTASDAINTAKDGIYRATFGFDADDSDHFWTATGPDDVTFPGATPGDRVGFYEFGLDLIDSNWVDFASLPGKDYELKNGAGQIYAPKSGYTFGVADDLKGTFIPVPEPSSIALLGLGLIGLAGVGRRKLKGA